MPKTLSPSRATTYKKCAQLYRFRHIDNLDEPQSPAAAIGNLVHKVLEDVLKAPILHRTRDHAEQYLDDQRQASAGTPWEDLVYDDYKLAQRFLDNYYKIEDPADIRPVELEWWVSAKLDGVEFRGIIDRAERDEQGRWILVDYKTGRVPGEKWELQAFFGLRFYALVCWRAFGFVPYEIRLYYLADGTVLRLHPNKSMLEAFEKQVVAIAKAIDEATESGDWRPRPGPLCKGCSFVPICPAWEVNDV